MEHTMKRNTKKYPIPFDVKLSYDLDKAIVAKESGDRVRQVLGTIRKRRIEKKIWGEE